MKHRLRFEPYIDYDDMRGYVDFIDTYSRTANVGVDSRPKQMSKVKEFGEIFGIVPLQDNPRKTLKEATKPLGNLPLEIITYIQGYVDTIIDNGTLKTPIYQMQSSKFIRPKAVKMLANDIQSTHSKY